MASEIKVRLQKAEISGKEGCETPVLDLSDAAVKELARTAEKRDYIAHNQINALLSSDEINSEQIENILANFSEMGINVLETKEPRLEEEATGREEPDEKEETFYIH
jgi:RNA polymerase primary sigma factor